MTQAATGRNLLAKRKASKESLSNEVLSDKEELVMPEEEKASDKPLSNKGPRKTSQPAPIKETATPQSNKPVGLGKQSEMSPNT